MPETLGRYTVLGRLGSGAVGEVFEAQSPDPSAPRVALKAIRGMSPDSLYRFKREFRSLADVQHRNVIRLHELVLHGDRLFFSMELVRGCSFVEHLCGPARPGTRTVHEPARDFDAVRAAMRQLAEGVNAIHGAGFLHRDLKPSNVLVDDTGRVVILDFGLVRGIDGRDTVGVTADGAVLGTPLFMSPEQASGADVGPASDWYTVGEMLYQVLTGRPPYVGIGLLALLAAKKEDVPDAPSTLAPGIPDDLEALCIDLLARDPADRPSPDDILRRLGATLPSGAPDESSATMFLGRNAEMQVLERAFVSTRAGQPVVVLLEGVSGIGKSALVHQFLKHVSRTDDAIVLAGKCSERESIPYKALDGVMDMLSAYLRLLPEADVRAVLPRNVAAITRLFPVLLSVTAIAAAPTNITTTTMMPQEARRRGIASLRELLGRIADRKPLVVYIDDLQWSDLDSLVVLEAVLRDMDAPPMLIIGSFREGAPERAAVLGQFLADLHAVEPPIDLRSVRLGPMGVEEARGLALRLLGGDDPVHRTLAEDVAREAEGSPFFVAQLVRHAQRTQRVVSAGAEYSDSAVSLDDVIRHRLALLSPSARRMLSVVSVAGGRLALGIAARLAHAEGSSQDVIATLRAESLVRTDGTAGTDTIEIYHDRIRETVLRGLSEQASAELHLEIGRALAESSEPDAAALSHHFRQAGEDKLASLHTIAAADQAADALAFDRAAELYQAALELGAVPDEQRPQLQVRHARALASAGRQYEAANTFLEAAEHVPEGEQPTVLLSAAELLLTSGHAKEGRVVLQRALSAYSLSLPPSRGRAIASLLANRAALALRGLTPKVRDAEDIDPNTLGKLDACWTATRGLIYTDGLVGADFHARHLRLALRSGDRMRISRALGFEAHLLASIKAMGKRERCFELVDQAAALAEETGSDYARGMVEQARGHVHMMLGEWNEAAALLDQAVETFRRRTTTTAQEIGYCESHAAICLQFMGRARDLAPRAHDLLRESTRRTHPYAQGFARGMLGHLVYLVDDRVEDAQEQLELYREQAPWGFQAHIQNYVSQTTALMRYRGDVEQAWEIMEARSAELQGFDLMRAPFPRAEHLFWMGQNALAMALRTKDPAPFLKRAATSARKLLAMDTPYRRAYGHLTLANVHQQRAEAEPCVGHLRHAIEGFSAHGMRNFVAVCSSVLSKQVGGSEGDQLAATARSFIEAEAIAAPAKLFEMMSPGAADTL